MHPVDSLGEPFAAVTAVSMFLWLVYEGFVWWRDQRPIARDLRAMRRFEDARQTIGDQRW